ncbi:MAG TPA: acetoacetate decarboxylase family protein [Deltaproteobacteria bacterium]|nr:acetoacetate decarboxylase family protein [Deltaproteobacteria bacterium]
MMKNKPLIEAPAPWSLMGHGYVVLVRFDPGFVADQGFVPEPLKGLFSGGFGTIMYVDYLSSDVGPYKELLFIPGLFAFGRKRYYSITKIYVSTEDSVVNGRNNWGIPKELSDFEVIRDQRTEIIRMSRGNRPCVELHFRSLPCSLPVTTALIPAGLRTLAHHHDGRTYLTTPRARGVVSPAHLTHALIDGSAFPDFNLGRILCSVSIPHFFMTFPRARIL